jgi:serine/threonine-protein kinase
MTLAAGTRLGSYEVLGKLGEGGMGEVYRARDVKLGRSAALKVLPRTFVTDPERVARFQREAQVLATLNHPHIASIFGLEESADAPFIAMELVEGESLAQRIGDGALPIDEALRIARQIAAALAAAHEKAIVHRDLKPANVMLDASGRVKVLDFGLAKVVEREPASASVSLSPTMSVQPTIGGTVLGTPSYMSPEQSRGKAVDKRTDIWAFGCVLFEMVTGRRAFGGDDAAEVIAAVMRGEPDWNAVPAAAPPAVHSVLTGCLAKDPAQRFADISVPMFLLENGAIRPSPTTGYSQSIGRWRPALVAAALVLTAAVAGAIGWMLRPSQAPAAVTRFTMSLPSGQQFTDGSGMLDQTPITSRRVVAISPDGSNVVYVAGERLYLRPMSSIESHAIPGSELGSAVNTPTFSPDGTALAFYSASDNTLKRLPIGGGSPVTICQAQRPYGMSWDETGIVFGQQSKGIVRVAPSGGAPDVIAAVPDDQIASTPQMLPGGRAVLFSLKQASDTWDKGRIVVKALGSDAITTVLDNASDGRYLPTGHLVYAVAGALSVVAFDVDRLTVTGKPVTLVEGVRRAWSSVTGPSTAQFAVSGNGTLAYVPGPVTPPSTQGGLGLAVFDVRGGTPQILDVSVGTYHAPRISTDGNAVVFEGEEDGNQHIAIYDRNARTSVRRLTFSGRNRAPVWSPDDQWIAFESDRDGDRAIFRQRADGSGPAERLTKPAAGSTHTPHSWSPDGAHLLFSIQKDQRFTLWTLSLSDRQNRKVSDVDSAISPEAVFSPDGKWVAYQIRQSAAPDSTGQVFVEPFPTTGAKYLVAPNGAHPFWSAKGSALIFYTAAKARRVSVTTAPRVEFSRPVDVPNIGNFSDSGRRDVDAMPDGEHVIGVYAARQAGVSLPSQIVVVVNWFDELRSRFAGN